MVQNIESTDGRGHSWAESLIAKRKFYFPTSRVSSKTNLESRHPARVYKLCPGGNRCKWPTAVAFDEFLEHTADPEASTLQLRSWEAGRPAHGAETPGILSGEWRHRGLIIQNAPVNTLILGYSTCWHLCLSVIHLWVEFTCVLSKLLGFQFNFILRVQASIAGTLPPNF